MIRAGWPVSHDTGDPGLPDVSTINGRPALDWEQEALLRYKLACREAAAELVRVARPVTCDPEGAPIR